jgi:hypothetical protein
VSRDTTDAGDAAPAPGASTGAKVIDLAELLSRSIQVANKPGPAKARSGESAEAVDQKSERAKPAAKKKRAAG